jgi:hypothetical protein
LKTRLRLVDSRSVGEGVAILIYTRAADAERSGSG